MVIGVRHGVSGSRTAWSSHWQLQAASFFYFKCAWHLLASVRCALTALGCLCPSSGFCLFPVSVWADLMSAQEPHPDKTAFHSGPFSPSLREESSNISLSSLWGFHTPWFSLIPLALHTLEALELLPPCAFRLKKLPPSCSMKPKFQVCRFHCSQLLGSYPFYHISLPTSSLG